MKRKKERDWQWVDRRAGLQGLFAELPVPQRWDCERWAFHAGRGVQEKTIGELKSGYAFSSIPTQTYSANTAWQKLNILAHNLMTTFQLLTTATKKPRTAKRTGLFLLRSVTTLRFEWLNRAARWLRPGGNPTLRLVDNNATRSMIEQALDQAA